MALPQPTDPLHRIALDCELIAERVQHSANVIDESCTAFRLQMPSDL